MSRLVVQCALLVVVIFRNETRKYRLKRTPMLNGVLTCNLGFGIETIRCKENSENTSDVSLSYLWKRVSNHYNHRLSLTVYVVVSLPSSLSFRTPLVEEWLSFSFLTFKIHKMPIDLPPSFTIFYTHFVVVRWNASASIA